MNRRLCLPKIPRVMQDLFFKLAVSPELLCNSQSQQYRHKVENDPNLARVKAAFAMAREKSKGARRRRRSHRFWHRFGREPSSHPRLGGTSRARTDGSRRT